MKVSSFLLSVLLCLLILTPSLSFSQKVQLIVLQPEEITIEQRGFFIENVLDKRLDKKHIGWIQKGLLNRRVFANLSGGAESHLKEYLSNALPQTNPEQISVTMVVNQLIIGEITGALKETGWAEISVGFWSLKNGSWIELYKTSSRQQNNGMDVTSGHDRRIKNALLACLQEFAAKATLSQSDEQATGVPDDMENSMGLEISSDYVLPEKGIDSPQTLPEQNILNSDNKVVGVYANLQEMLNNTPSLLKFKVAYRDKTAFLKDAVTSKKIKDAYGFYDGKNIYINTATYSVKKQYVLVPVQGRYFAWLDRFYDGEDAFAAGMLAGAGGAMVANDLDCICLDLATGIITPLSRNLMLDILEGDEELLKEYYALGNRYSPLMQLEFLKKYNERNPIK